MLEDMTWTQPKQLTFSGQMKMTWWALCGSFRSLAVLLKVVWSSGATVSFNQTGAPNGLHVIAQRNGKITSVMVEVTAR
jgi:hypothetical protein